MDRKEFMQMFERAQETTASEGFADAVRQQLAESKSHHYHEVPGEGFALCGIRHGVGFAQALVKLMHDDTVEVVVDTGLRVKPECEKTLRKLLRHYSSQFKLQGLVSEDGAIRFKTEPIDPINGRFDADKAVGLALSTIHAYAGVSLALNAGVPGWELLGYTDQNAGAASDDDDSGDGDGGTGLEMMDEPESLEALLEAPRTLEGGDEPATSVR